MILSEKIHKLRKENGLSQEDLAIKLKVSRQAVSKWEMGVIPDIDNVVKMARFFDCSIDYLLNDDIKSMDGSREDGDRDKINQDILSQKQKFKLPENWTINIVLVVPILIILIMWIVSKIVEVPITHQDYKTGNFYIGFGGFIDYFNLQGFLYMSIVVWLLGLFKQAVWWVYIKPKKMGYIVDKKIVTLYIFRFLLLLFGTTLFVYGILNPWKFSWNTQTILALSVYFIVVILLSITIKYFVKKHPIKND